ncbi:MAG: alpha/beta hydrolase [Bacteriovoracaceae bacterium]|nr:alpha/beta hydrolase [Bacteriovoracaceae bacterium]
MRLFLLAITFLSFNQNSAFSSEKKSALWVVRGLIRENAHSKLFIDKFKQKYPNVDVHALDLMGNGEFYKQDSFTNIKDYVLHARKKFLSKKDNYKNNFLIAVSMGGMVMTEWSRLFPKDFTKMIIFNTSLKGHCPIYERFLFKNIFKYIKYAFLTDPRSIEENIYSMIISKKIDHKKELMDLWVDIRKKRPVSFMNTIRQMWAAATYSAPKENPFSNAILGVGLSDNLVSPNCSKNLAKNWKLKLIEVPNAGHDLCNDSSYEVIKILGEQFKLN